MTTVHLLHLLAKLFSLAASINIKMAKACNNRAKKRVESIKAAVLNEDETELLAAINQDVTDDIALQDGIDVNDAYTEYCNVLGVNPLTQNRQHFLSWLSKQEFPAAVREMRRWDNKFASLDEEVEV